MKKHFPGILPVPFQSFVAFTGSLFVGCMASPYPLDHWCPILGSALGVCGLICFPFKFPLPARKQKATMASLVSNAFVENVVIFQCVGCLGQRTQHVASCHQALDIIAGSSLAGHTASELVHASHWATSGPSFWLVLWQVQWAFVERMLGRSFPSQDIVCKVREAVFGGYEEWDRTLWIVMNFRVVFDSCACCGLVFAWDSISAFCLQFFYT